MQGRHGLGSILGTFIWQKSCILSLFCFLKIISSCAAKWPLPLLHMDLDGGCITTSFAWPIVTQATGDTGECGKSLVIIPLWFLTADEPSRCYFHDGDGVCEEFEQMTSIKDCGVYTPKGFLDQWASNASVSHHSDQGCPGWVVIGQPAATQVRKTQALFTCCKAKSNNAKLPSVDPSN